MKKKLLTITKKDFVWTYYRGSGSGGQKRNKTDSACRCQHAPSKALACAEDKRSQHQNRKLAFIRCTKTKEFQGWLKTEIAKKSGQEAQIEEQVNKSMQGSNVLVETYEKGKWQKENNAT